MPIEIQILLPAFTACLVMTLLLAYFGIHVLARGIIFVDIAIAQIAAFGAALAALQGIEPHTMQSYMWSLGFTFVAAILFVYTRNLRQHVPQEAFIGIAYAVAAAAAILIANFLPHGDEEIKRTLVGSLLTTSYRDIGITALIFAVLGLFHFRHRKRFLRLSFEHDSATPGEPHNGMLWDLLFYMTFGIAITSAVQIAGVLLVFSFLIVPAVFSALFCKSLIQRLLVGWGLSALVSAFGLWGSFVFDLPTGAVLVVAFGAALLGGIILRGIVAATGTTNSTSSVLSARK